MTGKCFRVEYRFPNDPKVKDEKFTRLVCGWNEKDVRSQIEVEGIEVLSIERSK